MRVNGRRYTVAPTNTELEGRPRCSRSGRSWPQSICGYVATRLVLSGQVQIAKVSGDAGKAWLARLRELGVRITSVSSESPWAPRAYRLTPPPRQARVKRIDERTERESDRGTTPDEAPEGGV